MHGKFKNYFGTSNELIWKIRWETLWTYYGHIRDNDYGDTKEILMEILRNTFGKC